MSGEGEREEKKSPSVIVCHKIICVRQFNSWNLCQCLLKCHWPFLPRKATSCLELSHPEGPKWRKSPSSLTEVHPFPLLLAQLLRKCTMKDTVLEIVPLWRYTGTLVQHTHPCVRTSLCSLRPPSGRMVFWPLSKHVGGWYAGFL